MQKQQLEDFANYATSKTALGILLAYLVISKITLLYLLAKADNYRGRFTYKDLFVLALTWPIAIPYLFITRCIIMPRNPSMEFSQDGSPTRVSSYGSMPSDYEIIINPSELLERNHDADSCFGDGHSNLGAGYDSNSPTRTHIGYSRDRQSRTSSQSSYQYCDDETKQLLPLLPSFTLN